MRGPPKSQGPGPLPVKKGREREKGFERETEPVPKGPIPNGAPLYRGPQGGPETNQPAAYQMGKGPKRRKPKTLCEGWKPKNPYKPPSSPKFPGICQVPAKPSDLAKEKPGEIHLSKFRENPTPMVHRVKYRFPRGSFGNFNRPGPNNQWGIWNFPPRNRGNALK